MSQQTKPFHAEMSQAAEAELAAYKKAKAENDERFQLEAGELRAERDSLRAEVELATKRLEHFQGLHKELIAENARLREQIQNAKDQFEENRRMRSALHKIITHKLPVSDHKQLVIESAVLKAIAKIALAETKGEG